METVIRGVAVYVFLLVVTRLSGRRTLAQMTPFDFVVLLIVAETTQQALLADDFSLVNCFILILTLFVADILLSYFKAWSPKSALLLDGAPVVLVSRGEPDEIALRGTRVDVADIMEAARSQHGLERLDQVKFAVLEAGGNISIVPADR